MVAARWTAYGSGEPVTLAVHGLGATAGEARIPASGLPGTRVVVLLPSHGDASDAPPEYWNYARIAGDVLSIADEVGASQAVGVSLGAGALTRIAAEHPHRFDRLALLLPAAVDHPRSGTESLFQLADAVRTAETDGAAALRELVVAEVPPATAVGDYVRARTASLRRLEPALRMLPTQTPLDDAGALAEVTSSVLVVGATDDPKHPAEAAKRAAETFGHARLELLPSSAVMLTHRRELRDLLVAFLS